ncbi:MAG: helix-turn-helix transcriptional regulator [Clostridia bacterium]|nr:helix-turn-helix transcriptional regulator [Clostridia bacterium]
MYINIPLNNFFDHTPSKASLEVNCVGRSVVKEHDPTVDRPHGLPDYQMIYIESGYGYFKFGDTYEKISGKTVILFKPHEPQIYKYYKKDSTSLYWIHFSGKDVENILKELKLYDRKVIPVNNGYILKEYLKRILEEFQNKPTAYIRATRSYAKLALIELNREAENASKKNSDLAIEKLCKEMNMNFFKNIPNEEYAKFCNMSVPHFLAKFKSVTGTTPQSYILNTRIENSKNLLITTDYKIMEISHLVGFADSMYFCKRFKKIVGITPTEYRQKFQNSNNFTNET